MSKLVVVLLIVPVIVTAVVGLDFVLRGMGLTVIQLHLPRSGLWSFVIGALCIATAWYAKLALNALWKKAASSR